MKIPAALKSTKAHTEKDWKVLVISRNTRRYSKVLWILRVLIVEYSRGLSFYME